MTRFRLDVDPWAVRAAGTALGALEADLQEASDTLTAVLPEVQASWTGQAATALTAEGRSLARHASDACVHFTTGGTALQRLAELCADAVEVDVPGLNEQWRQAHEQHARAVALRQAQEAAWASALLSDVPPTPGSPRRELPAVTAPSTAESDAELAAAKARLEREFEELRDGLQAATRRTGAELAAATVVPVPPSVAEGYLRDGCLGMLTGWAGAGAGVHALQADLPLTSLLLARSGTLPPDSATLGQMLADARGLGLEPRQYKQVLQAYWQARAHEAAGIDPATWKPALGADHNRATIIAVYEYYGRLFRENPELEWAGLANLVGPGFAASFFDLAMMRDAAGALQSLPDLPGELTEPMEHLAGAGDEQLRFYETTFLIMQQNIFRDMGGMHEAYLADPDGLSHIQELRDARLIDRDTLLAWQAVDRGRVTGDPVLLHKGAEGLARREQFTIIGDDWDAMRQHAPVGEAITYAFTAVGKPSVEGARFPGEVSPLLVPLSPERVPVLDPSDLPFVPGLPFVDVPDEVELPAQLKLRTSLPDFNVADRDSRWAYFTADTLPRYIDLLEAGRVPELTARDMRERIAEERTVRRVPEVLAQHDPRDWRPVLE
jgi:hypothetical protein